MQSSIDYIVNDKSTKSRNVRVFFSSPFGGMEGERDCLTKKYFPELISICQKYGYDFIPIDLRWGITKEAAENAKVLWLCLREIERSDIFVGFYGMRYGWNGTDPLLLRNFEDAKGDYPWILRYKDRSVTELEMRQGHMNNPGSVPSCFFFRDEQFDLKKAEELVANKDIERNIKKYQAESDQANIMRRDLIKEIKQSREYLIGLKDYENPEDGAKKMYDCLKKHLQTTLPYSVMQATTFKEIYLQQHYSFLVSKSSKSYVGGENFLKSLTSSLFCELEVTKAPKLSDSRTVNSLVSNRYNNSFDNSDIASNSLSYTSSDSFNSMREEEPGYTPIVVISGPGGGKSMAICHWIKENIHLSIKDCILFYHFIGSATGSTNPRIILIRLILELFEGLQIRGFTEGFDADPQDKTLATKSVKDLTKEFCQILKQISKHELKALIILDSLHQLPKTKRGRPISWLPKNFPRGIQLIVSTSTKDIQLHRELIHRRKWTPKEIKPLDSVVQENIILQVLTQRGKELSPNQMAMILSNRQCSTPLYLTIVLEELIMFGDFFKLDDHMERCLKADNTKDLFKIVLQRMEQDSKEIAKIGDNVLKEIMSSLYVSHEGLSEGEIKQKVKISREWSPLYFSLEKFLIANGSILNFAYDDLKDAVKELYLPNPEDEAECARDLAIIFVEILAKTIHGKEEQIQIVKDKITRVASELPHLLALSLLVPGQDEMLKECLSNIYIFESLYNTRTKFDLIEFWNTLNIPMEEKGKAMSDMYRKSLEKYKSNPEEQQIYSLVEVCDDIASFLIDCGYYVYSEEFYLEAIHAHEKKMKNKSGPDEELADILNKLGNFYVDTDDFEKAETMQTKALEIRENLANLTQDQEKRDKYHSGMAMCYNGLAILGMRRKTYDQAIVYFEKALNYHKETLKDKNESHHHIADTENNIGTCYYTLGNYTLAIKFFEKALETYSKVYGVESLPPDIGGVLTNLAMCYRHSSEDIENAMHQADLLYQQALSIRERALGKDHPDIGQTLMAIGLFEIQRSRFNIAEEHFVRALEMFEAAFGKLHFQVAQACENLCNCLIKNERTPDALIYFEKVMNIYRKRKCVSKKASIPLLDTIILYHLKNKQPLLAYRLLLECIEHNQCKDIHFELIESTYLAIPKEQKPVRPEYSKLEKGFERFPKSVPLVKQKIVRCVANRDPMSIINTLNNNRFEQKIYFLAFTGFIKIGELKSGLLVIEALLAVSNSEKDRITALMELSVGYHRLKDHNKTLEFLTQLCELDPENYRAKHNLGRFSSLGNTSRGIYLLNEALQLAKQASDDIIEDKIQTDIDNLIALSQTTDVTSPPNI